VEYKIFYTPDFEKQFKNLCKKYKSLPDDLAALVEELKQNPMTGVSLGNNCYKIRLAIKSKGKGKSGGARVITFVFVNNTEVYLVTIYDKSEQASVSRKEILQLRKGIKK
jgi:hypothetical protein